MRGSPTTCRSQPGKTSFSRLGSMRVRSLSLSFLLGRAGRAVDGEKTFMEIVLIEHDIDAAAIGLEPAKDADRFTLGLGADPARLARPRHRPPATWCVTVVSSTTPSSPSLGMYSSRTWPTVCELKRSLPATARRHQFLHHGQETGRAGPGAPFDIQGAGENEDLASVSLGRALFQAGILRARVLGFQSGQRRLIFHQGRMTHVLGRVAVGTLKVHDGARPRRGPHFEVFLEADLAQCRSVFLVLKELQWAFLVVLLTHVEKKLSFPGIAERIRGASPCRCRNRKLLYSLLLFHVSRPGRHDDAAP